MINSLLEFYLIPVLAFSLIINLAGSHAYVVYKVDFLHMLSCRL